MAEFMLGLVAGLLFWAFVAGVAAIRVFAPGLLESYLPSRIREWLIRHER